MAWPDEFRLPNSRRTLAEALAIAAVTLTVWWPVLATPYVRDDWWKLARAARLEGSEFFSSLVTSGQLFFRPAGDAWFWLQHQLFGLDSLGYHVMGLSMYFAASLLVASLVAQLTRDRTLGFAAGLLHAGAASIYLDPLLWCSGIYDLGGFLFFLLAVWFFHSGRSGAAWIAYAAALCFKEATVILPLVLATHVLAFGERRGTAGRIRQLIALWPFALLTLGYGGWLLGVHDFSFSRSEAHPYQLELMGTHPAINLARYATWSAEALFPLWLREVAQHTRVLGAVLVAGASAGGVWLFRRRSRDASPDARRLASFLGGWWLLGLLPTLLLTDHLYRYYLVYSLPPFLAAALLVLRSLARHLTRSRRGVHSVVAGATMLSLASSTAFVWTRVGEGLEASALPGINTLVSNGALVSLVQDQLLQAKPVLPPRSILVFDGVAMAAFAHRAGPVLWYDDDTLQVLGSVEVGRDARGIYITRAGQRVALDPRRTFVFALTGSGSGTGPRLVERSSDALARSKTPGRATRSP